MLYNEIDDNNYIMYYKYLKYKNKYLTELYNSDYINNLHKSNDNHYGGGDNEEITELGNLVMNEVTYHNNPLYAIVYPSSTKDIASPKQDSNNIIVLHYPLLYKYAYDRTSVDDIWDFKNYAPFVPFNKRYSHQLIEAMNITPDYNCFETSYIEFNMPNYYIYNTNSSDGVNLKKELTLKFNYTLPISKGNSAIYYFPDVVPSKNTNKITIQIPPAKTTIESVQYYTIDKYKNTLHNLLTKTTGNAGLTLLFSSLRDMPLNKLTDNDKITVIYDNAITKIVEKIKIVFNYLVNYSMNKKVECDKDTLIAMIINYCENMFETDQIYDIFDSKKNYNINTTKVKLSDILNTLFTVDTTINKAIQGLIGQVAQLKAEQQQTKKHDNKDNDINNITTKLEAYGHESKKYENFRDINNFETNIWDLCKYAVIAYVALTSINNNSCICYFYNKIFNMSTKPIYDFTDDISVNELSTKTIMVANITVFVKYDTAKIKLTTPEPPLARSLSSSLSGVLSSSVTQRDDKNEKYNFPDGICIYKNYLTKDHQQDIVCISAAGIDFYTPTLPFTKKLYANITNNQQNKINLTNTITSTYELIFKAIEGYNITHMSCLAMGGGAFLIGMTQEAASIIKTIYCEVQINRLSKNNKTLFYYLNPGAMYNELMSVIRDSNIKFECEYKLTENITLNDQNQLTAFEQGFTINGVAIFKINEYTKLIVHDRDSVALSVALKQKYKTQNVGLLNPSDAISICLGKPGYYALMGRQEGFVGEEYIANISTLLHAETVFQKLYYEDQFNDMIESKIIEVKIEQ